MINEEGDREPQMNNSDKFVLGNVMLPFLYDKLPQEIKDKVKLYNVGDKVVFPIQNPGTKEMTGDSIYYLISYPDNYFEKLSKCAEEGEHLEGEGVHLIYRYGVKVNYEHFENQFYASLARFLKHLGEGTAKTTDTDGGDLGRGDDD